MEGTSPPWLSVGSSGRCTERIASAIVQITTCRAPRVDAESNGPGQFGLGLALATITCVRMSLSAECGSCGNISAHCELVLKRSLRTFNWLIVTAFVLSEVAYAGNVVAMTLADGVLGT